MAWIYSKTNNNILCMILFHLSINMTSVILLTEREGIVFYVIGSIVSAAICLLIHIFSTVVLVTTTSNNQ